MNIIFRTVFFSLSIALPVLCCLVLYYAVFPVVFEGENGSSFDTDVHTLTDAESFAEFLVEYGGDLEQVRKNNLAPPVYSANLPVNLARLPAPDKTSIFIALVLPNVLRVNDEIRSTRLQMEQLFIKKESYMRLTQKEQWWLNKLAWDYGCDPEDKQALRMRVDTVPVALALGQAINESGWGTSRFALAGNALYGQHLPSDSKGKYILSRHGKVKVAAFDSIYLSTRSYIHNLNRVRAYAELRQLRANLRENGAAITGHALASGLESYSELGKRYVRDLRYLIKRYELEPLNGVRLQEPGSDLGVQFKR